MIARPSTADERAALDACASEPIHRLGLVQPHGVLLVSALDTGRIEYCSGNVARLLGTPAQALLGHPLEVWLGGELRALVQRARDARLPGHRWHADVRWRDGDSPLHALVHCHDGRLVLELQPLTLPSSAVAADPWQLVEELQTRLEAEPTLEGMALGAARAMNALVDFERVMIYRFDAEWHGEVIAEVTRAGTPARFGGHWFPASDIPAQARALYLRSRVRLIADSAAVPAPLLAAPGVPALATLPPDLSHALLRSVSPVHVEYLRNMGVLASMSVSLVVEGRLWGLLVCHDNAPRQLSPTLLRNLDGLCQLFSTTVAKRLLELERDRETHHLRQREALLTAAIQAPQAGTGIDAALAGLLPALLSLCDADACLLMLGGTCHHGGAPLPAGLRTGLEHLVPARLADDAVLAAVRLDALGLADSAEAGHEGEWAGVLATRLPATPDGWIALCRRQRLIERRWGGDPRKPAAIRDDSARMSPRRSFETWREEVRGEAPPWQPAQVESLARFAASLGLASLQQQQHQALQQLQVLQAGLARISDIVLITDASPTAAAGPRIVYVNEAFEQLTGYRRHEVIGRTPRILQGPLTQRDELARIRVAIAQGLPVKAELINYHKDGSPYWLAIEIVPVLDSSGVATHFVAIESDISERKRQEGALREENRTLAEINAQLDRIMNTAQEAIVVLGSDGRIDYANQRFLDWAGRSDDVLVDRPLDALFAGVDQAALAARLAGPPITLAERFDLALATPAGALRWLRTTAAPIHGPDGADQGWLLMFSDVDALRATEQQLSESQQLLEQVGQLSHVGGWRLDLDTGRLQWTAETHRIHEVEPGFEPTLESAIAFYAEGDRERIRDAIERGIRGNQPWDMEAEIITARGRRRWVRAIGYADRTDGISTRLVGAFADISAQRALRLALETSNARFEATVRGSGAGHWDWQLDSGTVHYSDRFLELLGIGDRAHMPPRLGSLLRRADRADRAALRTAMRDHLEGRTACVQIDLRLRRHDHTRCWFSLRGECSEAKGGSMRRVAGSLLDIDERKRMEAALLALNTELESRIEARTRDLLDAKLRADEANHSKGIFLTNMSHELRSPLHSILGFAKLALEDQAILGPAEQAGFLRRITKSASHLLSLVNDLLDSAKFEARTFAITPRRCDLADVVRETGHEFERERLPSGRLRIATPTQAPIDADPERIGQVLRNLLANADRFTPSGGHIDVSLDAPTAQGWRLRVIDDGPGIAAADLERIFERFVQSEREPRQAKGGTGLGLSIARGIVELHGGTLEASNCAGRGACFTVLLPVAAATPTSPLPA